MVKTNSVVRISIPNVFVFLVNDGHYYILTDIEWTTFKYIEPLLSMGN